MRFRRSGPTVCAAFAVVLLVVAAACGNGSGDHASGRPAPPAAEEIRCPIDKSTMFRKGTGSFARAANRVVEVCSEGCKVRFELEPELFPEPPR